jgi:hypothetical protein
VELVPGLPADAGLAAGFAAVAGLAGAGFGSVPAAYALMPTLKSAVRINADELFLRDVLKIVVLIVPSSSF